MDEHGAVLDGVIHPQEPPPWKFDSTPKGRVKTIKFLFGDGSWQHG